MNAERQHQPAVLLCTRVANIPRRTDEAAGGRLAEMLVLDRAPPLRVDLRHVELVIAHAEIQREVARIADYPFDRTAKIELACDQVFEVSGDAAVGRGNRAVDAKQKLAVRIPGHGPVDACAEADTHGVVRAAGRGLQIAE